MLTVLRATEPWQKTGAHYVRIQGMARQHHITLRDEFDDHDFTDARCVVLLDDDFPVATCRHYPLSRETALIGRVVVLPEYRGQELGARVIRECEAWLREEGFREAVIDARLTAVGFYEKLGYEKETGEVIRSWQFDCVRMRHAL